ncbi:MAG: hypothetical protein LUH17_00945, partial [Acidaminococcaceae bacterium]|nr:hypothetical protein [Acidaminococcaceae bacterium]
KFEFTGGQFDMTKRAENAFNPDSGVILTDSKYSTVKINDLQKGGGTFIMDTDLASEKTAINWRSRMRKQAALIMCRSKMRVWQITHQSWEKRNYF